MTPEHDDLFRPEPSRGNHPAQAHRAVANLEGDLERIAARERTRGILFGAAGVGLFGASATGLVLSELQAPAHPWSARVMGAMGMLLGAGTVLKAVFATSFSERLLRLWRSDPALGGDVALEPVLLAGGGGLALVGSL